MSGGEVLVVGGTGFLGRKVVTALQRQGKPVRALVRPGSDASALESAGVSVVRGDMLEPASLGAAFADVDAVVSSAAGYTKRRKTDTDETDVVGNQNLAEAARAAGVRRFVLTGILTSDQTPQIPHFWHKTLAERKLAELGVPYVSLRPGAFFDQFADFLPGGGPRKGRLVTPLPPDSRQTYVLTDDVATALATLVDAPVADGEHIDLGWDRAVSMREIAALSAAALGHPVRVMAIPFGLVSGLGGLIGRFNPPVGDMVAMLRYFATGRYVADTRRAGEVFGAVPTAEDAVSRWAAERPGPADPGVPGRTQRSGGK